MTEEMPVELLEAQRRIRAEQVKVSVPTVDTENIDAALGKLKNTLDRVKVFPNREAEDRDLFLITSKLRESWNAPKRHADRSTLAQDAPEWTARYQSLVALIGSGFTVALVGTRGPGKTQMAVELMKEITKRRQSAYYCTAMDYFMRIKDAFHQDRKERQEDAQRFFVKPRLLVIDEVNVRSDSAWEDSMLVDLIGKRYNAVLDTVLISNETEEQFEESMGPSIIDRLNETGGIVVCDWKSFRE